MSPTIDKSTLFCAMKVQETYLKYMQLKGQLDGEQRRAYLHARGIVDDFCDLNIAVMSDDHGNVALAFAPQGTQWA